VLVAALRVLAHDAGKQERVQCMAFELLHHGWSLRASSEALREHCIGIFPSLQPTAQQNHTIANLAQIPQRTNDIIESVA
jgi:hypothetical protein